VTDLVGSDYTSGLLFLNSLVHLPMSVQNKCLGVLSRFSELDARPSFSRAWGTCAADQSGYGIATVFMSILDGVCWPPGVCSARPDQVPSFKTKLPMANEGGSARKSPLGR
jgi:hypothetical protein